MEKPFAPACERNREPILGQLKRLLKLSRQVLEISSGTGQHGVYFAEGLPHLIWQPTDLESEIKGIEMWAEESGLNNLNPPLVLDVNREDHWQELGGMGFDSLFTANSLHIMGEDEVEQLFFHLDILGADFNKMIIYGPFKYDGAFTTQSNEDFDQWLKARDPKSGVRDIEWICEMAADAGLVLMEDISMPANNQLLHFIK